MAEAQTVTTHGVVMGTFGYMSPEQLSGGEVDERSDLFSVGVVAAEVVAALRACPTIAEPALDADTVMFERMKAEG